MKDKGTNHTGIRDKMIFLGIGLGALFWILDSAFDVLVFHEGTFIQMLLTPEPMEMWMRLLVICILIIFGVYAQSAITRRKRMEQEILDKNEQLEIQNEELREAQEQLIRSEKLVAIGQLAGGVGHELRNPLGAIKNAVYYVKSKVAKSDLAQQEPRVIEFLDIADDEINSSNKIISDLLGFARVGKPATSPTRIQRVIEDALSRTPIPENIELTKRLDNNLSEVEIDPDQIQQVLVNIVTNAIQAMPEGGKLNIGAGEKNGFLAVEISDTGGGIPEEVSGNIFDPLFTTRAKGIGLGLAVCKSIIDRHEGHIEVNSQVGQGTTFSIKLPLKAA